jgi:hypothetical protein
MKKMNTKEEMKLMLASIAFGAGVAITYLVSVMILFHLAGF